MIENREYLFTAIQTGLTQMASSWNPSSKTYIMPSPEQTQEWQSTILSSWKKRQANLKKAQNKNSDDFKTRTDDMDPQKFKETYKHVIRKY